MENTPPRPTENYAIYPIQAILSYWVSNKAFSLMLILWASLALTVYAVFVFLGLEVIPILTVLFDSLLNINESLITTQLLTFVWELFSGVLLGSWGISWAQMAWSTLKKDPHGAMPSYMAPFFQRAEGFQALRIGWIASIYLVSLVVLGWLLKTTTLFCIEGLIGPDAIAFKVAWVAALYVFLWSSAIAVFPLILAAIFHATTDGGWGGLFKWSTIFHLGTRWYWTIHTITLLTLLTWVLGIGILAMSVIGVIFIPAWSLYLWGLWVQLVFFGYLLSGVPLGDQGQNP